MKTLIKRLLLPGYDLEKERAIQEAIVALRRLDAENKSLRVKIEQMERQEPVGTTGGMPGTTGFTMACFHADKVPIGFKLYALPGAQTQPAPSVPREAINKMLTQLMDLAVSNGANSISMPDEYVEVAAWLCGIPAQPAPSVPDGWLRAIDEALVVAHLGTANADDTYEQAKAKLDSLIGFHVDVATDPAVNGGWKLMPVKPAQEMIAAALESTHVLNAHRAVACYDAMFAAAKVKL